MLIAVISSEDRPGTPNDHEFRYKPIQTGQTEGSHRHEDQQSTKDRHEREEPAEFAQLAGVGPFIDYPDQEEHSCRGETMVEHLQYRAIHGNHARDLGTLLQQRTAIPRTTKPM